MRLRLRAGCDRPIIEKTFSFESEEEFTAWEKERLQTFGNSWSLTEETMHNNNSCWVEAKLQFRFFSLKSEESCYEESIKKEWCDFVLRHKHALCFYDECASFTELPIATLSKMSDEEILKLHAENPAYCDVNSIRDLAVPLDDNSWVDYIERQNADGSKDYFIEFSCFN